MADIRVYNVDALGKPLGQYSHVTRVAARELLFIAGMLAPGETFDQQCSGVFAQIAQVVKNPAGTPLLGTLRPRSVIAIGQSASAGALSRSFHHC